jgi:hypothetical protein
MAADAAAKTTTTAGGTLKAKGRDGAVVSCGPLTAHAVEIEGVGVRHKRVAALAS